jgi:hypothetical protein
MGIGVGTVARVIQVPAGGVLTFQNPFVTDLSAGRCIQRPSGTPGVASATTTFWHGSGAVAANVQFQTLFATIGGLWPQLLTQIAPRWLSAGLR